MKKKLPVTSYQLPVVSGFTLVEMLIYLGLFAGFLLVLTDIFVASLDVERESTAVSAVANDGQYILSRLIYDAGQAQDITQPAFLGGEANSLTLVVGGVSYIYTITGGTMTLTTDLGTSTLNTYGTTISGFTAKKIGNTNGKPTAQIVFTVTSTTTRSSGPETQSFETSVGVR